jgi:ABC-type sulfate transport system permease component
MSRKSRKYWAGAVVVAATLAVFAQPALASAESCCRGVTGEVVEAAASTGGHPKAVVSPVVVPAAAVQTTGGGCFWGCKIN